MTLTALEKASGISRRSITAYENGHTAPTAQTLFALASALHVAPEFLTGHEVSEISSDNLSFRAMSKLPASERDAAASASRIAMMIDEYLSARFTLPRLNLPSLPHLGPEEAAERVRADWKLGDRPIANMVHLLESNGIRVFSLASDCRAADAFCTTNEVTQTPFVFLNLDKSGERGRFDAAHELGHLVMHVAHRIPHGPESEKEAQEFASAFLMPRGPLLRDQPFNPSLNGVLRMKKRWRVAAVALTYRLHDLGMMNDWQYRTIIKSLAQMGYRRAEPGGISRETSLLLRKVLDLQMAKGRTMRELASAIGISDEELNQHLFGLVPVVLSGGNDGAPQGRPSLTVVKGGTA
jgi:Zn-dependent peptidase ImmA (M78 family)/DNA-binding XRE family transcriptional regulator